MISLILDPLVPKLFSSARLGYCSAGSFLFMLAWAFQMFYPDPTFCLPLWPLIGLLLGLALHFSQHKKPIFSLLKWVIGLIPLLYGSTFLLLAALETSRVIFVSITNIPYVLVSLIVPSLLIVLGVAVIRSKNKI